MVVVLFYLTVIVVVSPRENIIILYNLEKYIPLTVQFFYFQLDVTSNLIKADEC